MPGAGSTPFSGATRGLATTSTWFVIGALICSPVLAQTGGGSASAAVAGGVLGGSAGALVGNVGTILPCTQTAWGSRCVGVGTAVGGVLGLAAGIAAGSASSEVVTDRAGSGAVGFAVGSAAALVARPFFQRFGWIDVVAVGFVGGAIGTQPKAALTGASIGAAVGVVLWRAVPGFHMPDVIGAMLGGVALGVLSGWTVDAFEAYEEAPALPLLQLRVGI